MKIFKKPKFLIIGGASLLLAIVLTVVLILLSQPKTIGFFGLDRESDEAIQLQTHLESRGYTIYYAENMEDLHNKDCKAWIVRTTSGIFAEKILEIVGDKAIFIGQKPSLSQSIRHVGFPMEEAGKYFAELLSHLPNHGDTNEDGTVSCLLLTAPDGYRENTDWLRGLYAGLEESSLSYVVLDTLTCSISAEAGKEATLGSLSTYGRDIEVILTSSETLASGAAQAIAEGGWMISKDFYLLSVGHTEDALNAMHTQRRNGLVYASQEDFNNLLTDAVEDVLHKKAPKEYLVPCKVYYNASPLQ